MSASAPRRWHDRAALAVVHLGLTRGAAVDWLSAALLYALATRLDYVRPFQQDASLYLDDPAYRFPRRDPQTVPYNLLIVLTFWMPLGIVAAISLARRSLFELHIGLLSFFAGYNVNWLFTDFIKVMVGELRPDFFDRCQWNKVLQTCTGEPAVVQEGRRSFPSGHSSGAFFACVFLALFLSGKNKGFTMGSSSSESSKRPFDSKLLRFMIAVSPISLALYIALSRWEDHVHHPIDILAGTLLGTLIAFLTYHIYWPQSFTSGETDAGKPKGHAEVENRIDNFNTRNLADTRQSEREPLLSA